MTNVPLDPIFADLASRRGPVASRYSPESLRAGVASGDALTHQGPDLAKVREISVPGAPPVRVRIYTPRSCKPHRVMCYIHGGGWVTGDLDYADQACRELAQTARCEVVSVDYRLAPEHPFPAALHDVLNVLKWIREQNPESKNRIAVAGDSAGGNLAAAAARRAVCAGIAVHFQALIYPVLDASMSTPSYRKHASAFPLGRESMAYFWDAYAPAGVVARDDPAVSPQIAVTLEATGVTTPTLIVAAGHDPLHDEAVLYARGLQRRDVPCKLMVYPTLPHGFLRFSAVVPAAQSALVDIATAVDELFDGL